MRTGDKDRPTDGVRPVLILDSDCEAALAQQRELGGYEIAWVAIVHSVAQARCFLASGTAAAVLLTARRDVDQVLELARTVRQRGIPCLLRVPTAELESLAQHADLLACIALDCDRDTLSRPLARLGLRHVAPPS